MSQLFKLQLIVALSTFKIECIDFCEAEKQAF